jgi:GTP-binding protein
MSLPVVAIVGRPNVGKSTLFNRIVGKRDAVVDDLPGVTRDRKYGETDWNGTRYLLADTGGFIPSSVSGMEARVRHQVELAIGESDVVLFVTDGQEGLSPVEKEIASRLRKAEKRCLLVVNKCDNPRDRHLLDQFYKLGLSDPIAISATHGLGIGDLLDTLVLALPGTYSRPEGVGVRIAVVGRPNVGKSSIVNHLVNEDRLIVDAEPGTTRDSIDTPLKVDGKKVILIDTAGLRRRTKVRESVEYFSTIRSTRSIRESATAILVTDASEGPTKQDKRIAAVSKEYGKCLVIAANKSDLLDETQKAELPDLYRREFVFVPYAHIVLTSALDGMGLVEALNLAIQATAEAKRRVARKDLWGVVESAVLRNRPPSRGGRWVRVLGSEQKGISPPRFVIYTNDPKGIGKDYVRYLEKNIRREFGFVGTPVRISVSRRR